MAKNQADIPPYRIHKPTAQGYANLNGRREYFGRDSDDAKQRYKQRIAEWLATGRAAATPRTDLTIIEAVARWSSYAECYYGNDARGELSRCRAALKPVLELYGKTPARDFSTTRLKAVRQQFIDRGWCRKSVNDGVRRIVRMYRWLASEELVPTDAYARLKTLEGLRRGRTTAKESDPVRPVPDAWIEAARPHLSRQAAALMDLQLLTAARPGELLAMRPVDIDTQSAVWTFTPKRHKTWIHGHGRTIYLGPKAREIVAEFLAGKPIDAFIFSPKDADKERWTKCKTHRHQPVAEPKTKRRIRDHYDLDSYRRHIHRACDAAGIPRWSPNRLRHNAATRLRREHGIDIAQTILGHRMGSSITEIYAEANTAKAVEIMAKIG